MSHSNRTFGITIIVITILLFIVVGLNFSPGKNVRAFDNPHTTPYPIDTDKCAQCHRLHTAVDKGLSGQLFQKEQCLACHNGTGSIFNVDAVFNKSNGHSLGGKDVGSTKQCATCHEVHVADPGIMGFLVNPLDTREAWMTVDESSTDYDSYSAPSGLYMWCETCHEDSSKMLPGALVISTGKSSDSYVPYDVQVASWTSFGNVDNNDDTSTSKFWQYFVSETTTTTFTIEFVTPDNEVTVIESTETSYGYNDALAIGNSAHGRATSSESATAGMFEWNSPYSVDYPALSCKKCHDHHSSNQPWMIVDSITVGTTQTTGYDMSNPKGQLSFCESCHTGTYWNCDTEQKCTNCHRHGERF
jgi:predicted CXXCH cytochrome family protein